jgi:hypothetical protein
MPPPADIRYEGARPATSVLDADRETNAELTPAQARQAELSAFVEVYRALGGGWRQDRVPSGWPGSANRELAKASMISPLRLVSSLTSAGINRARGRCTPPAQARNNPRSRLGDPGD